MGSGGLREAGRRGTAHMRGHSPYNQGWSLREKKKKRKGSATPTETNVHGDAPCFMVKTWIRHKTDCTMVGGWRLAVHGWWRWAMGGGAGWRLAVGGP